jgi:dihydropyrimidinase
MPARIFGLFPRKGAIAPGADADLVIFDPGIPWSVDPARLQTNAKYSLWAGRRVAGKPVTTLVRGRPVLLDGEAAGARGWGCFLARADVP